MASMWTKVSRQPANTVNLSNIGEVLCSNIKGTKRYSPTRRLTTLCRHILIDERRKSLCLPKVSLIQNTAAHRYVSIETGVCDSAGSSDPYALVESEISELTQNIKKEIQTSNQELGEVAEYYFDGKGKAFRPMLVMLMAKAMNFHIKNDERLLDSQQQIAMIAEMIHTASLMHDDVIDHADLRRGKSSINLVWGQRKAILGGDYVMAMASMTLARIRNEEVVATVSQITEDLVRGEFMQLGSKEQEDERFLHYISKTFKKTASLLANSCKAVAILSGSSPEMAEVAYEYGRNVGITFQLIDDLLDFTSCDNVMGKPTAADLKLGLATAPVLFAAKKYPDLNALIMRRFSEDGDVERAREYVAKSNGVAETRKLAEQHSQAAVQQIQALTTSHCLRGLEKIAQLVLTRNK